MTNKFTYFKEMKNAKTALIFISWISFCWAAVFSPWVYINTKQCLFKDQYRLVQFKVTSLKKTSGGHSYHAAAIGTVDGVEEEMALGHFYLGSDILPADVDKRFSPGTMVKVYYNPSISNFTANSRTARFVSPERYEKLNLEVCLKFLLRIYGPFILSLVLWIYFRKHNQRFLSDSAPPRA